jgi:hypothetical protein
MSAGQLPEGAVVNSDGTVTLPLGYPIKWTVNGQEELIHSVTIRRKTMADNLSIKRLDNPIDVAITLIALLTGLHEKAVEKMDEADADAIGTIIEGFSKPGRATGSDASG